MICLSLFRQQQTSHASKLAAQRTVAPPHVGCGRAESLFCKSEELRTRSMLHLPTHNDPPHATVSSMIVDPASVPIPTATCR